MTEQWTLARVETDLLAQPETQDKLKALLPTGLTPGRFSLMALEHCRDNAYMLGSIQADGGLSFLSAVIQAAEVGLSLNKALGLAALTIRKGKVAFAPMYRGLVHLARQSGQVIDIWADVVYHHDQFRVVRGSAPSLLHEPSLEFERKDGDISAAYACARLRDSTEIKFEYVMRDKIQKCMEASDSWKSSSGRQYSPWVRNFPEMAKKTAVRQLCNLLQLSGEQWEKAIQADNDEYDWKSPTVAVSKPLPETPSRFVAGLKEVQDAPLRLLPQEPPLDPFEQTVDRVVEAVAGKVVEEKTRADHLRLMGSMLQDMFPGDKAAMAAYLEECSSFDGPDGARVYGFNTLKESGLKKVSDRWVKIAYHKVKDAWLEWQESQAKDGSVESPVS